MLPHAAGPICFFVIVAIQLLVMFDFDLTTVVSKGLWPSESNVMSLGVKAVTIETFNRV